MINKIFRKLTTRSIRSNLKQFLSVIFIVLLCTMLLSGFITNSATLNSSISHYFEDTNLADTWLFVDGVKKEDEEYFSSLKSNGDIKDFAKRFYLETSVRFQDLEIQNNAKIYVGDGKISNPFIESGKIEKGYGCLIDKNVAKDKKIQFGVDRISITYDASKFGIATPLELEFVITGTMSLDECADTYSSWPFYFDENYFLNGLNYALTKAGSVVKLSKIPYNQILLKANNVESLNNKIESYYSMAESNLVYMLGREQIESVVLLSSEISQSKKMIYVFPVIFLIVSILVIVTTIDQLVLQEKSKIGTLKSIGIPDKKILNYYSKYGGVLCFIGSIVGIILGMLIIPKIMFIKYNLVYSLPPDYINLKIPFFWLLLVLVGMTTLGYLVSLIVCHKILHKKPIECLRQDININVKLKSKNKKNKLPLSVKMAARNVKLKPVRTVMATIGIAGCVALLLCGFGINDTLNHSINNDFGKVLKYDITSTYTKADFLDNLNRLDGLEFYEKQDKYYAELNANDNFKNTSLFVIEPHSKLSGIFLEVGEVCLSRSIASELKVSVNDSVNVSVGGKLLSLKITKLIDTSATNGIFVAQDLEISDIFATKGVWIKCLNPSAEAVAYVNSINGTDSAYSMNAVKERIMQQISSIDLMTATLKTFAILLAIIVLLNLIFLIVKERIREIATLKVIGTNIFTITLSLFFEILFMATLGTAVGMCFGYPLLVLVLKINRVEIMNFLYHLTFPSFVLTFLIVFATIVATTALCLIKVKKVNMIESLKSVE